MKQYILAGLLGISTLQACDDSFKAKVERAYSNRATVNQILQKYCGNGLHEAVNDNYTIKKDGKVFSPYGHDITPTKITTFEEDIHQDAQNTLKRIEERKDGRGEQERPSIVEFITSYLYNHYTGNTASRLQNKKSLMKQIKNEDFQFKTVSNRHGFSFMPNKKVVSSFDIVELESLMYNLNQKNDQQKIEYLKEYKNTHDKLEDISKQFYLELQNVGKDTKLLNKIAPEMKGNLFRASYDKNQTIGIAKIINYIQTKKLGIRTNGNIESNATIEQMVEKGIADCDLLTTKFYMSTFNKLGVKQAFVLLADNEGSVDHIMPCLDFGQNSYCIESTSNKVDNKFIESNNKFARKLSAKDYAPGIGKLPFNVKLNESDLEALYLHVYETIPSEINLMLSTIIASESENNKMLIEYKKLLDFHKFILSDVNDVRNRIRENEESTFIKENKELKFANLVNRNSYRLLVEGVDMFNKTECNALNTKHFGAYLPIYNVDRNFFLNDLNNHIISFINAFPKEEAKIKNDFKIHDCSTVEN